MKRASFAIFALLFGAECRADVLFNGIVSIEIPEPFKKIPLDKKDVSAFSKTESVMFLSGSGTSFSVAVMSVNEEVGDLEKAGLTLEDVTQSDCPKGNEKIKKDLTISGIKAIYESCTYSAVNTQFKQVTVSAFVGGKVVMFNILGKASEEKEIEEMSLKVAGAKLGKG